MIGRAGSLRRWLDAQALLLPPGLGKVLAGDAAREVEAFVQPVSVRALERALAKSTDVVRYQLVERRLYRIPRSRPAAKSWLAVVERGFERMLARLLSSVPREVKVPSFDFAINLGDYPVRSAPILTSWSRRGWGNARLPPSLHWEPDPAMPFDDDRVRAHRLFEVDALRRPWLQRAARVVWRGSATGMYDRTFRFGRLQELLGRRLGSGVTRLDLCWIASRHPDVIDAEITGWPQVSEPVRRRLERLFPTGPRVPHSWLLRHRYVVNVDGNVATSSFLSFVGSGSVVLKQDSPYRDWCADHVRPGEQYLPVRSDLGDLVAVAREAIEDEERGSEIASRARRFAERHLCGTSVDFYTLSLLERYACRAPRCPSPGHGSILVR